ncbi:zinc finger MYM-type protein 1-like protein [Tanacetum coccineum]
MDSFFPAQLKAKLEEGSSSQRNDTGPETQESENDSETTKAIVNDICGAPNGYFAILVDEYEDMVGDEHIVVCLRYVDKKGDVAEKFLGIARVMDHKKDVSLKDAISSLLLKNSLSVSNVRGQSYNGVRKMYYDVSGLKTLIKNETQSAYYVHCFAQQLEPILVAVSQQNDDCGMFFYILEKLITLVGVCWKESEISTESRFQKLAQVFEDLEVEICEGSDEKSSCGPHYKSVLKAIDSYDKILDVGI